MADRTVESYNRDVPEIPSELERVLIYILNEGRDKVAAGEELVPFTALAIEDKLFIERHSAEDVNKCFIAAEKTVNRAHGADAYGFCYDGYIEVDSETADAVIAEGGVPGGGSGFAIGYVYQVSEDGSVEFEPEPTYIGTAPNFMLRTSAHVDLPSLGDEVEEDPAQCGGKTAEGDVCEEGAVEKRPSEEA